MPVHAHSDGVALLDGVGTVVKSPGVPQEAPVIRAARARGIVVLGELELGWRLLPNDVIAITGSNGKTTTTELVGGDPPRGRRCPWPWPATSARRSPPLAGTLDPAAVVVCEASSFQLEDTLAFAPDAAVLLNLAPDHLDRHGTSRRYREAKLRDLRPPGGRRGRRAAGGARGRGPRRAARRVLFGGGRRRRPRATGRSRWRGEPVLRAAEIRLRGAHNLENAMAASAVALARGLRSAAVRRRAAHVRRRRAPARGGRARSAGVLYVDDSKATNVASAVVGIRSFPGGVHAILGGRGKGEDYAPLAAAGAPSAAARRT